MVSKIINAPVPFDPGGDRIFLSETEALESTIVSSYHSAAMLNTIYDLLLLASSGDESYGNTELIRDLNEMFDI